MGTCGQIHLQLTMHKCGFFRKKTHAACALVYVFCHLMFAANTIGSLMNGTGHVIKQAYLNAPETENTSERTKCLPHVNYPKTPLTAAGWF